MTDDPSPSQPKSKGRAFEPTAEQRALASAMSRDGALQDEIAAAIGVSIPTLRKHFSVELAAARPEPTPSLFEAAAPVLPPIASAPEAPATPPPPAPQPTPEPGRPAWRPFDRERAEARLLIAAGLKADAIACRFGVSAPTFRKVFAPELRDAAAAQSTIRDAQRAEIILDMRRAARKGSVAAQVKLIELLESAERARIEASLTAQPQPDREPKAPRPALGKKEIAQQEAEAVAADPVWGHLIDPDAARLN